VIRERWWFGGRAEILVTAAQTGGGLSVIEVTDPPGERTPLHVHHREDETFYVLEGSVTVEVGDAALALGPGVQMKSMRQPSGPAV
jgi:mannose-6-phosphate isomerase-like protein (cupin superfamily)